MNVSTLRNWGGAVAVSLPKKLLAALGLGAGAEVQGGQGGVFPPCNHNRVG